MRKTLILLLVCICMVSGLVACGNAVPTEIVNITANEQAESVTTSETPHLSHEEISAIMDTMNAEQLNAAVELIDLYIFYSSRIEELSSYCHLATDTAKKELDRLEAAENALLNGFPFQVQIETNTRTENLPLIAVDAEESLYSYGILHQGEVIRSIKLAIAPGDSVEVNNRNYKADSSGMVAVSLDEAAAPLLIVWNSGNYGRLASRIEVESAPSDPIAKPIASKEDIPDLLSDEEFKEILTTMDTPQRTMISDLLVRIQALQEELYAYEDLSDSTEVIYELIHGDLEIAENALLHGIPFQMALWIDPFTSALFDMMAVESNSPLYAYPNPLGGLKGEKMVFVTIPSSTIIVNGIHLNTDENGMVEVPLEGLAVPNKLEIQIVTETKTFVVHMEGSGDALTEALPSITSSDNSSIF